MHDQPPRSPIYENDRLRAENEELRLRLEEAEQALDAIRTAQVESLVIDGPSGPRIFSLEDSAQSYRFLVEAMSEGATTVGADGTVLYCNRRFAEMLEQPLEWIMGSRLERLVPEERRHELEALMNAAIDRESRRELTLLGRGEPVPVLLSASFVRDNHEPLLCVVATDLREQKRNEELVASEMLARSVLEQAADAVVVCDEEPRVIRANAAAVELCVRSPLFARFEEAFRMQLAEGGSETLIARLMRGELVRAAPVVLLRGDGRHIELLVSGSMLRGAGGRTLGYVITMVDVTAHQLAQEALRESEERFRDLANNVSQLVWVSDPRGRMSWCNRRWLEFTGVAVEEGRGWGWQRLVHPDHAERVVARAREGAASGREWEEVFPLRGKDGNFRWFLVRAIPIRDADGRALRWVGTGTDITEQRGTEQALRERERQLEDLTGTLEQRVVERTAELQQRTTEVQGLAHQLRAMASELTQAEHRERRRLASILHDHVQQLLVATRMQLGVLRRGPLESTARNALGRADDLVGETIAATRSLTVELSPPVLYEAGLGSGLEWLARRMSEQHRFTVHLMAEPAAEPQSEELRVFLFEAVRELLLNAIKHAGVQSAAVTLRRNERGWIVLSVEDRGRGFDPDATRQAKAPGQFGLFSIQQRLAYAGGSVEVDSAPGQGTRIRLTVPPGTAPAKKASLIRPPGAAPPPQQSNGRAVRILIADDHEIVRDGLSTMLELEPGLEVVGRAADGREAVELARQLRPDVVLMDVSMPVVGGMEATRLITRELPATKVIGLSMYHDREVDRGMRRAGATAYLSKGGPSGDLIATISRVAGIGRAEAGGAGRGNGKPTRTTR